MLPKGIEGKRRSEQQGDAVDKECHEPGEDDGVDGGADGPFPAAGFLLYGDESGDAWEIEQDKHHEGKGRGRSHGVLQGTLEHGVAGCLGINVLCAVHHAEGADDELLGADA